MELFCIASLKKEVSFFTKGQLILSQCLRGIEKEKIKCARKFFEALNKEIDSNKVKYDTVDSFDKLMQLVAQQ